MIIQGLQKLTLLDYPGHMACTVFTNGCNLRCPFCHNASLVVHQNYGDTTTEDEFFAFLNKRKGILDGVCVTGGEPLLHDETIAFIKNIRSLGFDVKLDTNGTFPDKLKELTDNGLLNYVAIDIKNSIQKYPLTTGIDGVNTDAIQESIAVLKNSKIPYEFRTTVVQELHTAEDIENIAKWLSSDTEALPDYYLQKFVDSNDLICNNLHPVDDNIMEEMLKKARIYLPKTQLRGV